MKLTSRSSVISVLFTLFFMANVGAKEILNVKIVPVDQAMKFAGKTALLHNKFPKATFQEFNKKYEKLKGNPGDLTETLTDEEKKALNKFFPNFKNNYLLLQKRCVNVYKRGGKEIPRIEMPVIEPWQLKLVIEGLREGTFDIRDPHKVNIWDATQKEWTPFPTDLKGDKFGEFYQNLGKYDGDDDDDKVNVFERTMSCDIPLVTQSQIWLSKLLLKILFPKSKRIMVSFPHYWIIDGHHEYGRRLLQNPKDEIPVYVIDLDIATVLKAFRSIGNALGNQQKK